MYSSFIMNMEVTLKCLPDRNITLQRQKEAQSE